MIVEMAYEMGKADEIDDFVRRTINHKSNEHSTLETAIACRGKGLKHNHVVCIYRRGNTYYPVEHPFIGICNGSTPTSLHNFRIYLIWRNINVEKEIAVWSGGKPKERRAMIEALTDTGKAFTYHVLTEFWHASKETRADFHGATNIVDRAFRKTWN